jgi:hypothetical protein
MNEEILEQIKQNKPYSKYLVIEPKTSLVQFKLQDGPIQEVGINGCQIDVILEIYLQILKGFNMKFPCRENSITITKIEEAQMWQQKRRENRESRAVEGRNQL